MTHSSLEGRVILVSGGSRGLGREMAIALARAGAKLVITGSTLSSSLAETGKVLGSSALIVAADVKDSAASASVVEKTISHFGQLDVLINNAGLGMRRISETFNTVTTRFWEAPPNSWTEIVDTNVNGPFYLARAAIPQMLSQGSGKIINISTSDQTMIRKGYTPYGPSKAFLEAASRAWAEELQGTGIDVNILLPGGATDTDLLPPSPNKKGADGKLLEPAVMRAPILWLASDLSNGTTGGRFIATLWDENDPLKARSDTGEKPQIM